MLIKILQEWRQNGTYNDNNGVDSGAYHAADLWAFDTDTLAVVSTPFPDGGYYQQEYNQGDSPPENLSLATDFEFYHSAQGATRTGYYHDGSGGIVTDSKTITASHTVIGCNCWGTAAGIIDLTLGADSPAGTYTYRWNDGVTTADRTQVPAGTYSVTILHESGAQLVLQNIIVAENTRLILELRSENGGLSAYARGGVAPYTYQWDDGATEPQRPGLNSGQYRCLVRDSLGCETEGTAVVDRSRFFWSHDPIELRLDAGDDYRANPTTKPDLSFVCSVYVEQEYLSGEFELAGQPQEQPADRDGRTVFEVQELLEPFVECQLPVVSGQSRNVMLRANRNFRRFYLSYQERVDGQLSSSITSELSYLVYGGLSFEEAARGTWFNGYQDQHKPFLTWEPTSKHVTRDQPEFLYYIVAEEETTSWRRHVRVQLSDGQTAAFDDQGADDVRRHEVFIVPVSFEALDLARFETGPVRVLGWEVWVQNQAGAEVSQLRTYRLDTSYHATPRYFLYVNSLGGVNTLAAFGRSDMQLATKTTSSQLPRVAGYDAERGDVQIDRKTGLSTLKVYAGPRSREQMLADQDFMLSPRVLLYQHDRLQAGTVKDRSFTPLDEEETRRLLPFDFELPRQRHYTPRLV